MPPKVKIGMQFDRTSPAVLAWAKQHAADLVTDISETTRERIRDEVVGAFAEGVSPRDLADAIDGIVNDVDRAELIANTESMLAANRGQEMAWGQAIDNGLLDDAVKKEWIATGDKDVCDDCDELDGVTVALDEDFPNDGGEGPPLHPRCRCTTGIVNG
jgi:SPP1 gp7 family putative phage head morphogenesis protein